EHAARYDVPIDEYLRRCDGIIGEFERLKLTCLGEEAMEHRRSHEYGSAIIHSMVSGTARVVYGNQPNRGSIANLPAEAIVEVPVVVERGALRPTMAGALPPLLVGDMQPQGIHHELFIGAARERR